MRRLGLVAVSQPIFLDELGDNFVNALDDDYLARCYPVRRFLEQAIPVAFSTDAPVVQSFDPWSGIKAAVLRRARSGVVIAAAETISVAQAIEAYTAGSAYAEGTESFKGHLAPGQVADFVVVDRDPLRTEIEALDQLKTEEVYVGGERRWPTDDAGA